MKVDRCKGFRDLTPEDMVRFRLVEDVFRERCSQWGYREVRTPTLEYHYLFTSVGTLTPSMLKRVYSFLDWDGWSGERVVLKPDGTIPVARMYIENMAQQQTARLFYVTNIFIFDETGKKSRERWQCSAELIGVNSAMADAELIALAMDVLHELGIKDIRLNLSHAGLIKALLAKLDLSKNEQDRIFEQLLNGNREALAKIKPDKPELVSAMTLLLDMKGKSSGFLKNVKALLSGQLPEIDECIDNFAAVCGLIENSGCQYRIDLASGKGFEYYTGIIFRLFSGEQNIGGGGRYDALVPLMGGQDTPAAGFALYMDKLMELAKQDVKAQPMAKRVSVCVSPGAEIAALAVAAKIREAGYVAELALGEEKATDCNWLVKVQDKSPCFVLTDRSRGKESTADSDSELIDLLGCG